MRALCNAYLGCILFPTVTQKNVIIFIVLVAALYGLWRLTAGKRTGEVPPMPPPVPAVSPEAELAEPMASPAPAPSLSPTPTPVTTRRVAPQPKAMPQPPSSPAPSAEEAYQEALRVYGDSGYLFQFTGCRAVPGTLTIKSGAEFMLDNRDAVLRTIAVAGSQSFSVGAFGFVIAEAPATPGTHYLTCDGGGAASILVQL